MNRMIFGFILFISILLALNFNVAGFIGMIAVLWMMGGSLSYMITGKLLDRFWSTLFALAIGPFFLSSFFKALYASLWNQSNSPLNKVVWITVMFVLVVGASLYVRAKLAGGKNHDGKHLHTNERKPIFPGPDHSGEE